MQELTSPDPCLPPFCVQNLTVFCSQFAGGWGTGGGGTGQTRTGGLASVCWHAEPLLLQTCERMSWLSWATPALQASPHLSQQLLKLHSHVQLALRMAV